VRGASGEAPFGSWLSFSRVSNIGKRLINPELLAAPNISFFGLN